MWPQQYAPPVYDAHMTRGSQGAFQGEPMAPHLAHVPRAARQLAPQLLLPICLLRRLWVVQALPPCLSRRTAAPISMSIMNRHPAWGDTGACSLQQGPDWLAARAHSSDVPQLAAAEDSPPLATASQLACHLPRSSAWPPGRTLFRTSISVATARRCRHVRTSSDGYGLVARG